MTEKCKISQQKEFDKKFQDSGTQDMIQVMYAKYLIEFQSENVNRKVFDLSTDKLDKTFKDSGT